VATLGFVTRKDFLTAVVNGFEFVDAETFLRPTSDVGELCLIEPSFDTSCATIR
jgi:hypothetical protein